MNRADVAIAGAGIIGLATALELKALGRSVVVFDKGEAMSEASRAAAGMLAAADPGNPPQLCDLARLSLDLYPRFLAKIEELSGAKIPIRTSTTLQGVTPLPRGISPLPEAEVQRLAPGVRMRGKFFLIDEQSIDAWDLAEALPAAARAAGIELREQCSVLNVQTSEAGAELITSHGPFSAGAFLNCAGAWASDIDRGLPVGPRKGHMLTAELNGKVQMQCVLRTESAYIVPRGGNRYTVGPTVEKAGFDRTVHRERIQALFNKAADLWPSLREARIAETWIGFRPASEDGLPIIDKTGENRWVATGHYKNGIMLGPATARVLGQWITGTAPEIDMSPFRAARFAHSAVSS